MNTNDRNSEHRNPQDRNQHQNERNAQGNMGHNPTNPGRDNQSENQRNQDPTRHRSEEE